MAVSKIKICLLNYKIRNFAYTVCRLKLVEYEKLSHLQTHLTTTINLIYQLDTLRN